MNSEEYIITYDLKNKIADKIKNLTEKSDLICVKKIIINNNANIFHVKNKSGYLFTSFDKCTDQTFRMLIDFFNDLELREMEESQNTSDNLQHLTNKSKDIYKDRFKYTISEASVLKKQQYNKALQDHHDKCMEHFDKISKNKKSKE